MNKILKVWQCKECGHEVYSQSDSEPMALKWKDGHICEFMLKQELNPEMVAEINYIG